MSKTNYISASSILFDLSQLMDNRYWNETKMLEWVIKGYRSMKLEDKFVQKTFVGTLDSHKLQLPSDLKHIVVVALKNGDTIRALTPASSLLLTNTCLVNPCQNCKSEYNMDYNLVLTATNATGDIYVEYLAYPTNEEGEFLIPDDERIKEALINYVLWKYWLSKSLMKEDGAEARTEYFRNLWTMYSGKAMSVSLPDVGQLENIKNRWNHLVGRQYAYDSLFTNLNEKENVNF